MLERDPVAVSHGAKVGPRNAVQAAAGCSLMDEGPLAVEQKTNRAPTNQQSRLVNCRGNRSQVLVNPQKKARERSPPIPEQQRRQFDTTFGTQRLLGKRRHQLLRQSNEPPWITPLHIGEGVEH